MNKKLYGKTAIVTGATSGIGKATLERFAEEGAQVVFCGRRAEIGKVLEKGLTEKGYDVLFVQADCSIDSELDNLMNKAIEKYHKIDILFNNAGVLTNFAFEDIDMKNDYDKVFNTNVRSYFYASKLVLNHMIKAGSGVIINTASIGGLTGGPNLASYCSSKGAVLQLTRSLAKEFASRGIRVNAISPGLIYTEMMPENSPFVNQAVQLIPMQRAGTTREVSNCALFLACDDSSFINGQNLIVDGGQSA